MISEKLDNLFRFRSSDGKTTSFTSCLQNSPGSFFANNMDCPNSELPYIYCGGTINFNVPTAFRCSQLPDYLLIYISKGTAKLYLEAASYNLTDKMLIILGPESKFEFQSLSNSFTMDFFYLKGRELFDYMTLLSDDSSCHHYIEINCSDFIKNNLNNMIELLKYPIAHSELFLSKYLRDIICEIMHARATANTPELPKHVKQCKHFLEEEYMQPLSLDDLQNILNINKYRLCREFSSYVGISPMQYLLRIRIEKSKELLSLTDMTIHSVGDCVGIPNTTHFINQFKKLNNMTPLEYRHLTTHSFN